MLLILPIPEPVFPYDPEMEELYQEALALTKWKRERIPRAVDKVLDGKTGFKVAPSLPERTVVERKLTGKLRGAIQWRTAKEKDLADTFAEVVEEFASQLKAS
jgi:hypothetical protein